MLCPKCGNEIELDDADLSSKNFLCGKCQQESAGIQEQESVIEADNDKLTKELSQEAPDLRDSLKSEIESDSYSFRSSETKSFILRYKVGIIAGIGFILTLSFLLIQIFQHNINRLKILDTGGLDVGKVELNNPSLSSSEQTSSLAEASQKVVGMSANSSSYVEEMGQEHQFVPYVSGVLQSADITLPARASFALYDRISDVLQIAIFSSEFNPAVATEAVNLKKLEMLSIQKPNAVFNISLRRGFEICDESAIESASVKLFSTMNGLPFDYEHTSISKDKELKEFRCDIKDSKTLKFSSSFTGSKEISGKTIPFYWEIETAARIEVPEREIDISYDSDNASSVLAVWNKSSNEIEIGYFNSKLLPEDVQQIRNAKSLHVSEKKPTSVVVSIQLRAEATELRHENVVGYGVSLYRMPELGMDFPGIEDKVNFYYVPSSSPTEQFANLNGLLQDKKTIGAKLSYLANKVIEDIPGRFKWNLEFKVPLLDLDVESKDIRMEESYVGGENVADDDSNPMMRVMLDEDNKIEFKTVLAFYYPKENNLVLAFFVPQLSDAEKQGFRKQRSLWNSVNNKYANMLLLFDFKTGVKEASLANLLGYEMFFVRDKIGSFYFSGDMDKLSFARKVSELAPKEIRRLAGSLTNGQFVFFRIGGEKEQQGILKAKIELNGSAEVWEIN